MISRREVIVGGLTTVAIVAAGTARLARRGDGTAAPAVGTTQPAATPTQPPSITVIEDPAMAGSTAHRVDSPLRVDWVGGSDVAWEGVSLPEAFRRQMPNVEGRPFVLRTRTRQAVMADGVRELVDEAVAAGTEAIIMSINPVWLHWDEIACSEITVQHQRYECLLTPISVAVSDLRAHQLRDLIDHTVATGVPAYLYTQPHSADVLANPDLTDRIATAEEAIARYDPQRPHVRLVARIFTRELPHLREGTDFIDMVHPTMTGAEELGAWIADDVSRFWSSIGFGR
jgi:hypothetical protein